ncbi:MAG: tetratricopeptide repeat protein [Chloroherpetonaceae bacterium]|nr:tetratricopeptide repeat protein [Chloroherpetonaceae bacterium]
MNSLQDYLLQMSPSITSAFEPEFRSRLVSMAEEEKAYLQLGERLLEFSRFNEAVAAFQEAEKRGEKSEELYFGLGGALLNAGKLKEAASAFQKAVDVNPSKPDGYFYLANALDDLGESTKAIEAAESALKLDPNFAEARMALAFIHFRMGNKEALEREYRLLEMTDRELALRVKSLL